MRVVSLYLASLLQKEHIGSTPEPSPQGRDRSSQTTATSRAKAKTSTDRPIPQTSRGSLSPRTDVD